MKVKKLAKALKKTVIEVTSDLLPKGLLIKIWGREVVLPQSRAIAFLRMIAMRRRTVTGLTPYALFADSRTQAHSTIRWLRNDLNEQLEPEAADLLFESRGHQRYRLIPHKNETLVHKGIRDLEGFFLPADLIEELLADGPVC